MELQHRAAIKELFHAAQPIFDATAQQYLHLWPSGAGTTMKLVVNTLLGVGMQAIAEAVVLGEAAGHNRKLLRGQITLTMASTPMPFYMPFALR